MEYYSQIAKAARIKVLSMIHKAQSSHIGSNYSSIDILSVLFEKMDLKKDKFIASKGWIAASVYYFLAQKGVVPKQDLERYCLEGETDYIGLIEPRGKFGLEAAGGAVGYGLSFGAGFALSKKLKKEEGKVYVLMSDGEQDVGMVWETALIAAHYKLDNLIGIIDYNKFQATGTIDEVLNIEPLDKKWEAFGWEVYKIDGHDYGQIEATLDTWIRNRKKPQVIIANTVKGKGVKEFENKLIWHYKNVDDNTYTQAMKDLCT